MSWSSCGALALGVVLSVAVATAKADDTSKPRAAIVLSTVDGTDGFVAAYLFEVAAAILRADGYDVAPVNATAAHLASTGSSASACVATESCVADLARTIGAPTLLFIDVTEATGGRLAVSVRGATVRIDGVSASEPHEGSGTETDLGEPVQVAAERLTDTTAPCHFEVDTAGLEVQVSVNGGPSIAHFPFFVEPGEHSIVVSAPRRAPHERRFSCDAGKLYRVGVR